MIIAGAQAFVYVMEPSDIVDFIFDLSNMLAPGEKIDPTNWQLTMSPEGTALGVQIGTAGLYAPQVVNGGLALRFWLSVTPDQQANILYNGAGTMVPILVIASTTNAPPRTFQRTLMVRIAQR